MNARAFLNSRRIQTLGKVNSLPSVSHTKFGYRCSVHTLRQISWTLPDVE